MIEKYFHEVLRCFTMTNIRLKGGKEIDLLAVNPRTGEKWHVEARVSTTFKLRVESTKTKNGRSHKDGLDYFYEEKFNHPTVKEAVKKIFGSGDYKKVIVVWGVKENKVFAKAKNLGIEIWLIADLIKELKEQIEKGQIKGSRDDILRTIELVIKGLQITQSLF